MSFLAPLGFYPTLGYNLLRNWLSNTDWPWYCRIDETVILGALPFRSMIDELKNKENVAGVVCLNEAHEIEHAWAANKAAWEAAGVRHFWLPVPDFFYAPDTSKVHDAVTFIRQHEKSGKSVYVHCKAGRSRSAMVVICYLMQKHNWYSPAAHTLVKAKRPRIILRHEHWNTIEAYSKQYVWKAQKSDRI